MIKESVYKKALRGKTVIFCFLDELSWFTGVEQDFKNPEEVLKALDSSLSKQIMGSENY